MCIYWWQKYNRKCITWLECSTVMHELLVRQLVNGTLFYKEQFRKNLKETFRNKMQEWRI